jgi:hypothetical protein
VAAAGLLQEADRQQLCPACNRQKSFYLPKFRDPARVKNTSDSLKIRKVRFLIKELVAGRKEIF